MFLADRLTLDGPRRDSAGNLVASVLAARTGIQDYAGYEVGKPDMARVKVYRPADEVFSRDSMKTFAGAPVTIEHPSEMVTPANWRDHARGEASEEIVRDGEAVRVPFLLRDAAAIDAVEAGKREISMGYSCDLDWTSGTTDSGEAYDAIQRNIRINHLAIVDRARGGPSLRIGDQEPAMTTKTITFDGLPLVTTDAGEAAINKLLGQITVLTTDKTAAETLVATHVTTIAAKDAEIATLKQQVIDAKVTPAQMRDAAKAYALTLDHAKKLAPTASITDSMDEVAIKRVVVDSKLGDAAKGWTDEQVAVSFSTMAIGLGDAVEPDPLRAAIADGAVTNITDAASIRNAARASRYAN